MNVLEKIKMTYNFKANNTVEMHVIDNEKDFEKLQVKIFGVNRIYNLCYILDMAKKENLFTRFLLWDI